MKQLLFILFLFLCVSGFAQRTLTLHNQTASGSHKTVFLRNGTHATGGNKGNTLSQTGSAPATDYNTFSLSQQALTSAGVYDSATNTLVRTLWSGVTRPSGTNIIEWDGKDDKGNTVSAAGKYFDVVSNNLTATWRGVIGNTSDSVAGDSSIWVGFNFINHICYAGGKIWCAMGYREGAESIQYFDTATPGQKRYLTATLGLTGTFTSLAASDGTTVYWAAHDPFKLSANFIYATQVSNTQYQTFTNSKSYDLAKGPVMPSVTDSTGAIQTGLAVQQSGNYLFVAYSSLNQLHVLNKTTGALVQNLTYTNPRSLATDGSSLWMTTGSTVARYTVNSNGTLSSATLTLSGLVQPQSLTVSGSNLLVCDGGSKQQLRTFNTSTGTEGTAIGTLGGYNNAPDVSTNKFYFSDIRDTLPTGVAFQPDGSYWVIDWGNYRVLHYHADKSYYNQLAYIPAFYAAGVDLNNPTRVFADYLEFAFDYNNPDIKTAWTLAKNWGYNIPSNLDKTGYKLHYVNTLSNGRTYAMLQNETTVRLHFVELTASGIRDIGDYGSNLISFTFKPDGSMCNVTGTGGNTTLSFLKTPLTGFDASGNPVWGSQVTLASTNNTDSLQPVFGGAQTRPGEVLSNNVIVSFNGGVPSGGKNLGYHLGGLKIGDTGWQWKTAYTTPTTYKGNFPTDGGFEGGNGTNYAGSIAMVQDSIVVYQHHGEFYKLSQTNKYNAFFQNGLFLLQFGVTRPEVDSVIYPAQMAGNGFSWLMCKYGGKYYIWQNDENTHDGLHLWQIDNITSIKEYKTGAKVYTAPIINTIDLMTSVPTSGTFYSTGNWTRYPNTESNISGDKWIMTAGLHSYGKSKDIQTTYSKIASDHYLQYTFPTISSTDYTLSGNVSIASVVNNNGLGGMYLDLLDGSSKIIGRWYSFYNNGTLQTVYANTVAIRSDANVLQYHLKFDKPLSMQVNSSGVKFTYDTYNPVTTALYDATADWQHPKYLKLSFFTTSGTAYTRTITLQNFKLTY